MTKKKSPVQVFSCKFCEIFQNIYFVEHLWTAATGTLFCKESTLMIFQFLAHLMICCKLDDNQSVRDFILQSQAPMYTAIKLTLMFREESERVQDKSQDYDEIAAYCEVILFVWLIMQCVDPPKVDMRVTFYIFTEPKGNMDLK